MKIIYNKNKLVKFIKKEKNLGFVPTMGGIHLGHMSLINKSISQCKKTIVSIFINKSQFNKKDDFQKYPRTLKSDIAKLSKLKIDYLFVPSSKGIYPTGINRDIKISIFGNKLCGKFRPGHFRAVTDVIDRFIKIIKPNKIYFGEKDMQQLKIIENFVKKNHIKTKVIGCKTIREKNGMAYSSRNFLLSPKEKLIGSSIYKLIAKNKKKLIKDNLLKKKIEMDIYKMGAYKIDYFKILNINKLTKPYKKKIKYRVFIAYYLKTTRLIDNI